MINVRFFRANGNLTGFEISGHSGSAEYGSDIVCAAISSCAYMTANTITDIIGIKADITVDDGYMSVALSEKDSLKAKDILSGFRLHIAQMAKDYPDNITLTSH